MQHGDVDVLNAKPHHLLLPKRKFRVAFRARFGGRWLIRRMMIRMRWGRCHLKRRARKKRAALLLSELVSYAFHR